MKVKTILLSVVVLFGIRANAQDFLGYNYSNYQAAGGMIFNPASIAESSYKVNVNILSLNVGLNNNAYHINKSSLSNLGDFKEGRDYFKVNDGTAKDLNFNLDVLAPSFMIDFGKKIGSVGFSSRLRLMINENNLDSEIFKMLGSGGELDYTQSHKQDKLRLNIHSFSDYGLTYARTVWEKDNHLVKAGVTAKYIVGFVGGSLQIDNLEVEVNQGISSLDDDIFKKLHGDVTAVYSDGVDALLDGGDIANILKNKTSKSLGFDIGAEYEWYASGRSYIYGDKDTIVRKHPSYTLKVSASITDIGSVAYTPSANTASYRINGENKTLSDLDVPGGDSFDDYINYLKSERILEEKETIKKYKMSLPTVLRINVDWNAWKKFYVNIGTIRNLVSSSSFGARYANQVYLTPRYESSFLSVYSPISLSTGNFNWGLGFNFGAFFIGSGSVISCLTKEEISGIDLHLGLAVPIGKKKK